MKEERKEGSNAIGTIFHFEQLRHSSIRLKNLVSQSIGGVARHVFGRPDLQCEWTAMGRRWYKNIAAEGSYWRLYAHPIFRSGINTDTQQGRHFFQSLFILALSFQPEQIQEETWFSWASGEIDPDLSFSSYPRRIIPEVILAAIPIVG